MKGDQKTQMRRARRDTKSVSDYILMFSRDRLGEIQTQ
jgi:hypothetical protein